jgi:NAD-dependent dihydropyrimidine dehydrogenase PreA subunit
MPLRNIILIDEEKCDGCGKCVDACVDGAIEIINGKAKLVGEIYCDGFGACLGSCPQDALIIEKRDAKEYSEEAVAQRLEEKSVQEITAPQPIHHGCPGSAVRHFAPNHEPEQSHGLSVRSQLGQWPVQLMLVPPTAPYLKNADLLICADCVPLAVPDFHNRYLKNHAILVGCPKLDNLQYYFEKLKDIFRTSKPSKITVLKMDVPCCNGIAQAAIMAQDKVGADIPVEIHTIGISGGIEIEMQNRMTA